MKLCVWNIQGLTSRINHKLKNNYFKDLCENYDIIIFTETWSITLSDMSLDGFEHIALHRPKKRGAKRSSGGVAIYYKQHFSDLVSFERSHDDCILWNKLSFSKLGNDKDVLLCGCYNVPSGSSRYAESPDIMEILSHDLRDFNNVYGDTCDTVITGDFNARTGTLPDYIVNDTVDYLPLPEDYQVDDIGETKRSSKDIKQPNAQGNALLQFCKMHGHRIVNGSTGSDKGVGEFTCINRQGKSVVDYVICPKVLYSSIKQFDIEMPTVFSDHCHISWVLQISNKMITDNVINQTIISEGMPDDGYCIDKKFTWDVNKKYVYRYLLSGAHLNDQFQDIFND